MKKFVKKLHKRCRNNPVFKLYLLTFYGVLILSNDITCIASLSMQSLTEQIYAAEKQESLQRIRDRIWHMTEKEKQELIRYFKVVGATDLAWEFFSLNSLDIESWVHTIYTQKQQHIYIPYSREKGWLIVEQMSEHELDFLLRAFFRHDEERNYIIRTVFYRNNFLNKINGDTLDYLERVEWLFQKVSHRRQTVLHIIWEWEITTWRFGEAANDTYFIPLIERIEHMEWGYFNYIHEVYKARLEYVESIFCQVVMALAEEWHNHIWVIDPENIQFYIPPHIQGKIDLIRSICEFHMLVDPNFPLLHTLIESTVASWILVYKWFSAPINTVRKVLWLETKEW